MSAGSASQVVVERLPCPFCDRTFVDENARYQHAVGKHRSKKLSAITPEKIKAKSRKAAARAKKAAEQEETFAEMAIEAQQLQAAGLPVPEDIAWLLP